jgi:hypothetical protein
MEPNAFTLDNACIRWGLQQLEDKAGLWAVRQMQRMTLEVDSQGRPPKELRHWQTFKEFFMAQFGDSGLINKAKQEWNSGITQTGKAVDYFEKLEILLLRLSYPRNSEVMLDKAIGGLKQHIRTHFIGRQWVTLNDMKEEIIPYDAAHWEINTGTSQKKEKTSDSKDKKGKGKAEVSRVSGQDKEKDNKYLSTKEFQKCKDNGWCFKCKAEGKEVKGSSRYHPKHLPDKKAKVAMASGSEKASKAIKDRDTDSDSDSESESKCDVYASNMR